MSMINFHQEDKTGINVFPKFKKLFPQSSSILRLLEVIQIEHIACSLIKLKIFVNEFPNCITAGV